MNSLTLAFRNILRNKRRTALTLMAIIFGVTGIMVFGGFIEFAFDGLRETTIRTQLGHVQIYHAGYSDHGVADPSHYLIRNPAAIEKALQGLPHVAAVTRRLTFNGLVSTGEKTLSAHITGVMPAREEDFSAFETVLAGQQLDEDTPTGGVIGVELAKALNAKVGDRLSVLTTTLDGVINAIEFEVVGIAQTGSQDYDSVFVKLPLSLVQRVLATTSVEKVLVLLADTKQLSAFIPRMRKALDGTGMKVEFRRWDQLAFYYKKVVALYQGLFNVIKVIICVIVLFSIVNTMTMSVFERTREIGTLRAIGTHRGGIMRLFLAEGFWLGVIGGLLGVAFGAATATAINLLGGISIPAPPGMSRGYVSMILIVPEVAVFGFLLAVSVAVSSSIWPAWKATKIKVVEALAHT